LAPLPTFAFPQPRHTTRRRAGESGRITQQAGEDPASWPGLLAAGDECFPGRPVGLSPMERLADETSGSRCSRNDGGGRHREDGVRADRNRVLGLRAGCPHQDLMATWSNGGHPKSPAQADGYPVHHGLAILREPKEQYPRRNGWPLLRGEGWECGGSAGGLENLTCRPRIAAHIVDARRHREAIGHPGGVVIRQGRAWGIVEARAVGEAGRKEVGRRGQCPKRPPPAAPPAGPPISGSRGLWPTQEQQENSKRRSQRENTC
jgi:hypothetical protein